MVMDSTNTNSIFAEYKKVFVQFKLRGIDVNAIHASRCKDVEAIVEASKTALAGVQSLAQKQSDIVRATLNEFQSFVTRGVQSEGEPTANASERVQQSLHKALVDMQELANTIYRAQSDSVAVVTKRVAERVEELKAALQPKT
jgi:phasin family protein